MKSKIFLILSMICIISMFGSVNAMTTLHEESRSQILNSGTKLTTDKRLTDKGWLNINIVEVDLKDKYTEVGVLTSENGLQTFQTVKAMALHTKNCIAAINADFFTGNSKKGNCMGLTITDGEVLTSTYYENEVKDTFATFIVQNNNSAFIDYFTNDIVLKNKKNNVELKVCEINKWSSDYSYPVLYTSDWGKMSLGSTPELILTELVVKNNKVLEVRVNEEPVEIPENGFVICALGDAANLMCESFKKGNKVELSNSMELNVEKVKAGISGGSVLVKDGKVCEFTHNITGQHPRTAIGISKDESKIYLITVDGRQKASVGVTQTELAEILVEKGIYTAMNLDGGGSTTLVTRKLGDELCETTNLPSEGTLRNVPNALAVFNTSKTGKLDSILLEVDDVNVFVNGKKEIRVKGYDKYYNPVEINEKSIKWSYKGAEVSFDDNILVAGNEAGTSMVIASIGGVKGSIEIDVLSRPNELTITPKRISLNVGEKVSFKVRGQNKNGYFADLKTDEVLWNLESGSGEFVEGVFTAKEIGSYVISASAGNAKCFACVNVVSGEEIVSEEMILPKDIKGADELQVKEELYSEDAFRIVVSPNWNSGLLMEQLKNKKLEEVINNQSEIVIFPTQSGEEMLVNISKEKVLTGDYGRMDYKMATIITLDIANGGLRATNSNQWLWLKEDIRKGNQNILIVLNGNLDDFKDEAEKSLFIDVLCDLRRATGKNIWVIQNGNDTEYSMKRGIKYLSVASNAYTPLMGMQEIEETNYILITVNQNKMTYEIKNVYER